MAESTEHKKEQHPLTEEEVEALAEKFTASWDAADDSARAEPDFADQPASTGTDAGANARVGVKDLKRTMLGIAPGNFPVIPNQTELPEAEPTSTDVDANEDEATPEGAIPRQRTLLGIQAPDPSLVRKLVESFERPAAAIPAAPPEPPAPASAPPPGALEAGEVPIYAEAGEREVPEAAAGAGFDVPVFMEPAPPAVPHIEPGLPGGTTAAASRPAALPSPVTLGPRLVSESEAAINPSPAPLPTVPATGLLQPGSASFDPPPPPAAQEGPGLFGWSSTPAPHPASQSGNVASDGSPFSLVDTSPETPSPIAAGSSTNAASLNGVEDAAVASPHPAAAAGQPPLAEPPVQAGIAAAPIVPLSGTIEAAAQGTSGASRVDTTQSYVPPAAPPPASGVPGSQNEKSVVVEADSVSSQPIHAAEPDEVARRAADRAAQTAETMPPSRPRTEDSELVVEFQPRSSKKVGLLIAGGLAALIAVVAVVALSGDDSTAPTAEAPDTTTEGKAAATPESAAKDQAGEERPASPESPAAEKSPDAAASAAEPDTDAEAVVEEPVVAPLKPKRVYRPPPKKAAAPQQVAPTPRKTTKAKRPTSKSKTIVRDAPF